MDLLSKDEPLINFNGYDSQQEEEDEERDDLLNQESLPSHNQRRINATRHSSSNRQNRLSSSVYLREISPVRKEPSKERHSSVIVAAVERTMKNYADGVLRVLEGMSGRLSQLELTTQDLEQSVASLKVSVDDYHKSTNRNFNILGESIVETHRAVQILRDKQDIFEAQAQLAKLQTSQALVEKESAKPSVDPTDATTKTNKQQELTPQVQPQHLLQHSSQQLVPHRQPSQESPPSQQPTHQHSEHLLPLQQPSQQPTHQHSQHQQYMSQSLPQSQPLLPQSQHQVGQQYQMVPSVQLQQQGGVPQEASAQYQVPLSQQLPTTSTPLPPSDQIHYLPSQVLPPQAPHQLPTSAMLQLPEPAQFQQQRQIQQILPPPLAPQPPLQVQQPPLQGPQPPLPPPPPTAAPLMQQQPPTSHPQSSFQYYTQSNDYAPGTPPLTSSGYAQETPRDPANYAIHQRPFPTLQPRPPSYLPQVPQSSHESNIWNRQTNPTMARLPTAQPLRSEHSSPEVNGVVEKVAAMGFSREQVQNVIRRLAERNQAIDMNIVLDILMNGGYGR